MPGSSNELQLDKIAVVGSGAVGGYFGGCLAAAGKDVHFLLRSDYDAIMASGLRIQREHAPEIHLKSVQGYRSTAEIGHSDLVIVALKTTQNRLLSELLPPLIGPNTVVLTLQNGLGNVEYLEELFGTGRVLGALVYMGINRISAGSIRNFTKTGGYLTLGEPDGPATPRVHLLRQLFAAGQIDCRPVDDLQEALWRKLIWNVPFNGLAIAAGGITCDQILDSPELADLGISLMKELQAAAQALGRTIPDSFIEAQYPFTRPLGAYKPSSLVDFLAGREVEVESIWGEPLRRGQQLGVPMPHLATLYALLQKLGQPKSS